MNRIAILSAGVVFLVLSGCASQVINKSETPKPAVRALQNVTVEMSPEAKKEIAGGMAFDLDILRATLQEALASRDLVAPDGDFDLKVLVTDVRLRGTASAVFLGFLAGDDHLNGDAVVLNRNGETVYTYAAEASYALGGVGGGDDSARLQWLYKEFSELISDELVTKRDENE